MAAIPMNKERFAQLLQSEKPVLVDFWAPWCGYCRRIGPAYDRIAEEFQDLLVAGTVNVDEYPELAESEQIEVLPTLVLYRDGTAIASIVAPDSKAMIAKFLKEALTR